MQSLGYRHVLARPQLEVLRVESREQEPAKRKVTTAMRKQKARPKVKRVPPLGKFSKIEPKPIAVVEPAIIDEPVVEYKSPHVLLLERIASEKAVQKQAVRARKKARLAYRALVDKLSSKQPIHTLENFDKRGFNDYHMDHIVSVFYGWKNNIPAEQIAHISNLRMIPKELNELKGNRSLGINWTE